MTDDFVDTMESNLGAVAVSCRSSSLDVGNWKKKVGIGRSTVNDCLKKNDASSFTNVWRSTIIFAIRKVLTNRYFDF